MHYMTVHTAVEEGQLRKQEPLVVVGPRRHVHQPSLSAEIVATIAHQTKLQAAIIRVIQRGKSWETWWQNL